MRALLVDAPSKPRTGQTRQMLLARGWEVIVACSYGEAMTAAKLNPPDAVLVPAPNGDGGNGNGNGQTGDYERLLRMVEDQRIAALILDEDRSRVADDGGSLVEVISPAATEEELRGRFAMIERYHEHFRRMDRELQAMERLGKRLNDHFREVDQEMRLAARLQRDFLPRDVGTIGGVRFATIFRPATWVSGDIYDICRVDERHTAFYVADAVGHGMAASLLTIFIKRAIVSKRIEDGGYTIVDPAETMQALNDALADEALPNCQFVTACYALLDHQTLTLRYARGGHPYPVVIRADGGVEELQSAGGLLGVFAGEEFPAGQAQLCPGDKLLMFTDGIELAFESPDGQALEAQAYRQAFAELAPYPIEEAMRRIEGRLDGRTGSLNPRDDVTIVGLEVLSR